VYGILQLQKKIRRLEQNPFSKTAKPEGARA
jgi:NADH-quinone oxidoreductase subunit B